MASGGNQSWQADDPEGPAAIRENFSRILEGSALAGGGADGRVVTGSPAPRYPTFAPTPPGGRRFETQSGPPSMPEGGEAQNDFGYYTHDLDIAAAKLGYRTGIGRLDFFDIFPAFFTFCGLLVFLPPVWITVHLGDDRSVHRWVGPWCQIAIFVPFLFVAAYAVHRRSGLPNKTMVTICLLVPSVLLLGLNDAVSTMAKDKGTQLFSTDCDVVETKRDLERSWLSAYRVYQRCLAETVPLRPNLTMATARQLFRIQDCEEYAGAYRSYQTDWDYLRSLEENHYCGGWCTLQRPLWTFHNVTDSCSVAVATVLKTKVGRFSSQVVIYMIMMLLGSVVGLVAAGPALRKLGVDW